ADDGPTTGAPGFDYMHARYYSPALGRFLSIDAADGTKQRPQSWNRYSYADNNPMVITDPTGAVDWDFWRDVQSFFAQNNQQTAKQVGFGLINVINNMGRQGTGQQPEVLIA